MLVIVLNDWQIILLVAKLPVIWHEIERIIEYLSKDIVLTEKVIETEAVFHLNDIEVISMINIGSLVRSLDSWDIGKCLSVLTAEVTPQFSIFLCGRGL